MGFKGQVFDRVPCPDCGRPIASSQFKRHQRTCPGKTEDPKVDLNARHSVRLLIEDWLLVMRCLSSAHDLITELDEARSLWDLIYSIKGAGAVQTRPAFEWVSLLRYLCLVHDFKLDRGEESKVYAEQIGRQLPSDLRAFWEPMTPQTITVELEMDADVHALLLQLTELLSPGEALVDLVERGIYSEAMHYYRIWHRMAQSQLPLGTALLSQDDFRRMVDQLAAVLRPVAEGYADSLEGILDRASEGAPNT